ncbi:Crp/Fnr family transcriptional regulator [Streptomyces sp. NPDC008313]|uniref:Crp/Fnr family transcriptional regulator n=1 Tax=Streptomyces sp. NPDC008313 TaxID=3364826 RepID=UPI0036E822CF
MSSTPAVTILRTLPVDHRERLMGLGREVAFPQGTRLFDEGGQANRFWVIRTGTVTLDMRVPGRRPAVIETLGHNELIGCSWLFEPHTWHLGAEATTPVRAYEFDAETVRTLCRAHPGLGAAVAEWVGGVVTHRLRSARTRLLDLYAPYGSGGPR